MAHAAAAEAEQDHRQVLALGSDRGDEAVDDLHLAAVHQTGAAGGHPGFADQLGDLGAALDGGEDLGVEPVDLQAQFVDVRGGFGFERSWLVTPHSHLVCDVVAVLVSSDAGLPKERSPGSGSGPRGSGEAARPRAPHAGTRNKIVPAG